jgi:hypothetical protein
MMFKGISVVIVSVKCVTYNIPTTPSRPIIDAPQIPATCMSQYHKSILPRAKMGILIRSKFASSSEFKSDSNALIFSLIGRELSELREFYKIHPEMEIFRAAPSVLQTAVIQFFEKTSDITGNATSEPIIDFPLSNTMKMFVKSLHKDLLNKLFLIFQW